MRLTARRTPLLIRMALLGALFYVATHASLCRADHSKPIDLTADGMEVWNVNPEHGTVSVTGAQGISENTLIAEIGVLQDPWTLDIHPSNGEVWVACRDDDAIVIIDGATRTVIDTITGLGFDTFGICFSPDGSLAAVTAAGSDQVFLVDTVTRLVTDTFAVYRRPYGIAWVADGSRFYVSHLLFDHNSFGTMTKVAYSAGWSVSSFNVNQDANVTIQGAGYPSSMMCISIQPPPADSLLLIPCTYINTLKGQLTFGLIEANDMSHAVIRPVNILRDRSAFQEVGVTYKMDMSGTPVSGPIGLAFKSGKIYVANLSSGDLTVLSGDILTAVETGVIRCGEGPLGVVAHPTLDRVYVYNWLSRDLTVVNTLADTVFATVPVTTWEPLAANVLSGKQTFFSSRDSLSFQNRHSCNTCHVFASHDGRAWDFRQFGAHFRATPDIRTIALTGPHNWTASMDEIQDHEYGILDLMFGTGLISGGPNPKLGAPNAGLSQRLDDMAAFISTLTHRTDTPFQAPGGGLTATADSGRTLFNDPTIGCAGCHVPPYFTDSNLSSNPYILHDVGTADPADTLAAAGFDTPTLMGVWDSGYYMHNSNAATIRQCFEPGPFNPNDLHGVTSGLTTAQIGYIEEYVKSIGAPQGVPTGVESAATPRPQVSTPMLGRAYPNPLSTRTSMKFLIEQGPAAVKIELYNLAGRQVRTLLDRSMPRGRHIVGWDSRDDQGRDVANGTYFARLRVNGRAVSNRKITVLR